MIYPTVDAHALLTPKAAAKVAASDEHQNLAEDLLGLQSPALTVAADVARIQRAIVEQINFQVEQGIDPLVESYASSSHSNQQVAYRDRVVSPRALAILANVTALIIAVEDRWDIFTSHRTRED